MIWVLLGLAGLAVIAWVVREAMRFLREPDDSLPARRPGELPLWPGARFEAIPRCGSCRFWLARNETIGECRRRAPLVALLDPAASPRTVWPRTNPGSSCGDFKPAPVKVELRDFTPGATA